MTIKSKIRAFIKRRIKDFALDFYFPWIYSKAAKKAIVGNKVVFVEAKESFMPDSFRVIDEYLHAEYDFEVKLSLLREGRVSFMQYYKNCIAMLQEVATAKYVFLNDASSIISCLKLRSETSVTQLWHACGAFKKWGMSTADLKFGGSREEVLRHPFYKNLSLVTVSSPAVIWAYAEAMVLEDQKEIIKPLGVSRTDVFFDEEFISGARDRVGACVPASLNKKVILYAPTFRGRVASAEGPDELDIIMMMKSLGDEYILLIKHHPFVKKKPSIPVECKDFAFCTGSNVAIDDLLCVADICITDYSSLIFEYSLREKPLIFFAYDLEDYIDWRGFYYDYDELTPGPVYKTTCDIVNYIEGIAEFEGREVRAFRDRFMSACDGEATKRICDAVFGEDLKCYRRPLAREVLSERNPTGKDVSIIIPAFNAMPELTRGLQSVIDQTYDLNRIEVIVVDDGSKDGTWEEIERFISLYPNLFVAVRLLEPSGSPAKPRNAALNIAKGEYIFFLDADDWLGPEAVEKMLNHAISWDSDVLFVKMRGENGREVPQSMFTHNQSKVDLYESKILWSIGPLKLYRRSLLEENNIRFFEEGMPEDLWLVLAALVEAKIISVASDYDYYHVCWREGEEGNTSLSIWDDLESNLAAYEVLFDFIKDRTPEESRDKVLMRRLFRRDVYYMLISLIENYRDDGEQAELYSRIVELFSPFYREEMFETSSLDKRLLLDAGMSGNLPLLRRVIRNRDSLFEKCAIYSKETGLFYKFETEEGGVSGEISKSLKFSCMIDDIEEIRVNSMLIKGHFTISRSVMFLSEEKRVEIVIKEKGSAREKSFPCAYRPVDNQLLDMDLCEFQLQTTVDFNLLNNVVKYARLGSRWYAYLRFSGGFFTKEIRIGSSSSTGAELAFLGFQANVQGFTFEPYLTEFGNFSFKVRRS